MKIGERIGSLDQVFSRLSSCLADEKKMRERVAARAPLPRDRAGCCNCQRTPHRSRALPPNAGDFRAARTGNGVKGRVPHGIAESHDCPGSFAGGDGGNRRPRRCLCATGWRLPRASNRRTGPSPSAGGNLSDSAGASEFFLCHGGTHGCRGKRRGGAFGRSGCRAERGLEEGNRGRAREGHEGRAPFGSVRAEHPISPPAWGGGWESERG